MISITSINYLLKNKLNIYIKDIKVLSSKGDHVTCLIDDEYIFRIILNPNEDIDYSKEKDNLDYIECKLPTSLSIPNIKYSYISDDIVIKGYKKIDGIPLNTNIFRLLNNEQQDSLASSISSFLKQLHSISVDKNFNIKDEILSNIELIKEHIYYLLSQSEKDYINTFLESLSFIDNIPNVLSHNSLKYDRFIINKNELVGIVGFDRLDVRPIYTDFIPLLEDEELAKKIVNYYGDIKYEDILEYKRIMDLYYPLSIIAYGIKKNRNDILERGRRLIENKIKKID